MGIEPTGDVSMTDAVKKKVKHLCRKNNVIAHILLDSDGELQEYLYNRDDAQVGFSYSFHTS